MVGENSGGQLGSKVQCRASPLLDYHPTWPGRYRAIEINRRLLLASLARLSNAKPGLLGSSVEGKVKPSPRSKRGSDSSPKAFLSMTPVRPFWWRTFFCREPLPAACFLCLDSITTAYPGTLPLTRGEHRTRPSTWTIVRNFTLLTQNTAFPDPLHRGTPPGRKGCSFLPRYKYPVNVRPSSQRYSFAIHPPLIGLQPLDPLLP
jgi:hypothetical protein